MRIIYLHQYFTTPQMSGGTRSYEFARRLVAEGHDVHMITSDRTRSGKTYETVEEGIKVTWIPVSYSNSMGPLARIRSFIVFAAKSSVVASRSKADLVFATSTPLTIAIPGIFAKWRQKIPMVFEVRDPWPEMLVGLGAIRNPIAIFLATKFERFAYKNSDRIIALSDGMKDIIVDSGYVEELVTVIPNAADLDRFDVPPMAGEQFRAQFDWLQQRKLVLYAGALGIANAVDYLAEVARHMLAIDPEVRFLVVGSGGQEKVVRDAATATGTLNKNFFMMPSIPKTEIPAVFSSADISLVLLKDVKELWTNSSNKFFDGLAAGRPVVVNNVGWQATLLNSENAGFDIDPCDFQAAAKKLYRYLSDDTLLREAGANAQKLARDRFDRDMLAARFLGVLQQALPSRGK